MPADVAYTYVLIVCHPWPGVWINGMWCCECILIICILVGIVMCRPHADKLMHWSPWNGIHHKYGSQVIGWGPKRNELGLIIDFDATAPVRRGCTGTRRAATEQVASGASAVAKFMETLKLAATRGRCGNLIDKLSKVVESNVNPLPMIHSLLPAPHCILVCDHVRYIAPRHVTVEEFRSAAFGQQTEVVCTRTHACTHIA